VHNGSVLVDERKQRVCRNNPAVRFIPLQFVFCPGGVFALCESLWRYGMSPEIANLTVAQVSICLLASGCIIIGLAPDVGVAIVGLVVVSLGLGFGIAMQSFATTLVSKEHIAKLYAGISVFETLGSLLSHPIIAASLAAGINMRGILTGLPFYLCALLYGVAAVPVWIVRVRHLKQDKHNYGNRQTGERGATTGR